MKKQLFNIRGMMRDLAASKGSNQYAYEIRNLRLTAQEDSTFLALTTEKGNLQYTIMSETISGLEVSIMGTIVGYCTVGTEYIVLFTHDTTDGDFIYRLHEGTNNTMLCKCLYGKAATLNLTVKDLGFTNNTKIDAIGIYENENIQKVYWIDGVNQPRVINIVADSSISNWDSSSICPFDFMLKMELNETVSIVKNTNIYGIFTPGTIQYVFSYHTKMGQQTPAFYVSPIYYTSPATRGASPEDSVSNAFTINLFNLDTNFNYVDIYSIQRTSEDGTPICKKVAELKMTGSSLTYIDNGINTEIIDYSEILYLGGTNIVPYTMEQKNNVLFFGNIKYNTDYLTETQKTSIFNDTKVEFVQGLTSVSKGSEGSYYIYDNQLDKSQAEISTFMSDESYYIGIILQDEYGVWSDVIPVGGDSGNHGYYVRHTNNQRVTDSNTTFKPVNVKVTFGDTAKNIIKDYKKIKIVRLKENPSILCQGVLAPTVYNKHRKDGVYAQSSWFFRPINGNDAGGWQQNIPQWRHNRNIGSVFNSGTSPNYFTGEITGSANNDLIIDPPESWVNDYSDNEFFIDWNLITMHSPEIELGEIQDGNFQLSIIGDAIVNKSANYVYLALDKPTHGGKGLIQKQEYTTSGVGKGLLAPLWFEDDWASINNDNTTNWGSKCLYPIYTWSRSILTTQRETSSGLQYSTISAKCISSLRTASTNTYKTSGVNINTSSIHIYQEDEQPVIIDKDNNNPDYIQNIVYQGAVDTTLAPYGYAVGALTSSGYNDGVSADAISMKYKSSKHAVMQLRYDTTGSFENHKQNIIPNTLWYNDKFYQKLFWSNREKTPSTKPTWWDNEDGVVSYIGNTYVHIINLAQGDGTYKGLAIKKEFVHKFTEITSNYCYIDSEQTLQTTSGTIQIKQLLWTCVNSNTSWAPASSSATYNKNLFYLFRPVGTFTKSYGIEYSDNLYKSLYSRGELSGWYCYLDGESGSTKYAIVDFSDIAGRTVYKDEDEFALYQEAASYSTSDNNYVYLATLKASQQNLTSFNNTSWIVASTTINIPDIITVQGGTRDIAPPTPTETNIRGTIGDAYYQRFDCLKTYPYSFDDMNQVVEILSFMCETHINIDGRYDTKRGLIDNTTVNGENFNLLNKGYTQDDNIFSSSFLDAEDYSIDTFPNQLIWTKQKVFGSHIDGWTHVVATSTLDMDGNRGSVTALKLWNDKFLCFQDRGVALIKYNENVAISSTTGTPIELANSNKVDGKQYISTIIGCSNKETIQATTTGLYFADSNTREIYKYSEGLQPISKSKGFNTYFYDATVDFSNMKTFYDSTLKDVYFRITRPSASHSGNVETLIFNEQFEEFTSLLDYDMDYMFSYKDSLLAVVKIGTNKGLWKQFAGDYLNFFGTKKGYSLELLCSENPTEDKTFTNVEFRADVFNNNNLVNDNTVPSANVMPFSHIRAWNEYQNTGDVAFSKVFAANMSQKFRIWRGDIPRDSTKVLDRIRNTWIKLKLYKTSNSIGNNNYKTVIHDVGVSYI